MRLANFSWAALSLVAFCAAGQAAEKDEQCEAKPLHVKVRAVDTSGRPITGAVIESWRAGGEPVLLATSSRLTIEEGREIRTADDGQAAFSFAMAIKPPQQQQSTQLLLSHGSGQGLPGGAQRAHRPRRRRSL